MLLTHVICHIVLDRKGVAGQILMAIVVLLAPAPGSLIMVLFLSSAHT